MITITRRRLFATLSMTLISASLFTISTLWLKSQRPDGSPRPATNSESVLEYIEDPPISSTVLDTPPKSTPAKPIARKKPTMAISSGLNPALSSLLSNPKLSIRDEAFELSQDQILELFELLDNTKYVYSWPQIAHLIGINGVSDAASALIIGHINDFEVPHHSDNVLHDAILWNKLEMLKSLGFTKGEAAENFLLEAYENLHQLNLVKKMHHFAAESGREMSFSTFNIDYRAKTRIIAGLILLDEPKYSPMLDADYRKLQAEVNTIKEKPDAPGPYRYTTEDEQKLTMYNLFTEVLLQRDMHREYGQRRCLQMTEGQFNTIMNSKLATRHQLMESEF